MIHLETLTENTKELFPKLSAFCDTFYLAGGTALALQLGHRISIDFDLFSAEPIRKTLLSHVESVYEGLSIETLINTSRELTVLVHGVKHTFLHYPFPVLLPLEKSCPIDLLSTTEILATKAYTIGRRESLKDYVDILSGIQGGISSLQEIINLAQKKYGNAFNDRLFLEQLMYLDDIEDTAIVMLNRPTPTKQDITDFFSKEITNIEL